MPRPVVSDSAALVIPALTRPRAPAHPPTTTPDYDNWRTNGLPTRRGWDQRTAFGQVSTSLPNMDCPQDMEFSPAIDTFRVSPLGPSKRFQRLAQVRSART